MQVATPDDQDDVKKQYSGNSEMQRKAKATRAGFRRPANWVMCFGWSLAICAGIVNVVAMQIWGAFVSHVTGSTTNIGLNIEGYLEGRHEWDPLGKTILLVGSFLFGAFLCGVLIDKNQVHLGGKASYGVALVANGVLLAGAVSLSKAPDEMTPEVRNTAACLASIACGLQNAMCTAHFGAVVRTTHVTGTITDIGSTLGRITMIYLRRSCSSRRRLNALERAEVVVDARKLLVLGPMWCSFLCGCIIGAYLGTRLGAYALLVPAGFTFAVGSAYLFFRAKLKLFFKGIMQDQLNHDLDDVEKCLGRTRHCLHDLRKSRSCLGEMTIKDSDLNDLDDLELEVEHILETVHQVEDDIVQMHSEEALLRGGSAPEARGGSAAEKVFGGRPDAAQKPSEKSQKPQKTQKSSGSDDNFVGVVSACSPRLPTAGCGPGFSLSALCGGSR